MTSRLSISILGVLAVLGASSARAQGVLVRGAAGLLCVPGGEETAPEASCDDIDCSPPRVCIPLEGLGARCLDPEHEVACFPGDAACETCPLISTGADPETCGAIELASGGFHSVCYYGSLIACMAEALELDPLSCFPAGSDSPSVARGDCDEDGVPNAEDACVCESAPGTLDGCPHDAGVAPEPDASVAPEPDAATSSELDAAAPGIDTGPRAEAPSFRGGGGCTCGAGRRASASLLAASALFLVAASAARRRT